MIKKKRGSLISILLFSVIILTIGMGFGRFLYTALFPLMLSEGIYNFQQLSYMASFNYIGYLLGALLFSLSFFHKKDYGNLVLRYSLLSTCLFLFLMSLDTNYIIDSIIRFLAGVSSAGAIIFGSSLIMRLFSNRLIVSAFFSGVGLGIFLGSEIVNIGLLFDFTSSELWFYASLISLGLAIIALLFYPHNKIALANRAEVSNIPKRNITISWLSLVILYGLSGFGYIITTTYFPILAQGLGDITIGQHLWAFVGVGAMLSCYCWMYVAEKIGEINALNINLLSQSIFVALSYFDSSYFLLLVSALGVGITFMGTTLLVVALAKRTASPKSINLIGLVTFAYGIGQILGPILTSYVQVATDSISFAILAASFALLVAAVIATLSKKHY
ncbi:YbfB/YjiJ family MFS transporter [Ignatzschineria indica]|nr:YbfB/YjiJ family MFS transporter [Ignatzschineria indica]